MFALGECINDFPLHEMLLNYYILYVFHVQVPWRMNKIKELPVQVVNVHQVREGDGWTQLELQLVPDVAELLKCWHCQLSSGKPQDTLVQYPVELFPLQIDLLQLHPISSVWHKRVVILLICHNHTYINLTWKTYL